jgi:hypothetical protein
MGLRALLSSWGLCNPPEDQLDLDGPTMRKIRADSDLTEIVREQEEVPRGRRGVIDGPPPTKALSKPWGSA